MWRDFLFCILLLYLPLEEVFFYKKVYKLQPRQGALVCAKLRKRCAVKRKEVRKIDKEVRKIDKVVRSIEKKKRRNYIN